MAESPLDNSDGPLGVTIKLDGSALDDSLIVEKVHVLRAVNHIPEASFTLISDEILLDDFAPLDSADFKLGTAVEIGAFYGSGDEQTLFKGIVTAYRLRLDGRGGARMELTCRDKAIAMTEVRTSVGYEDVTDSDVMTTIVTDAGLSADITATSAKAPLNLRVATTDWDFLRLLADRNGQVITIDDAKVTSAPIDDTTAAVLTVSLGMDLVELDISVDAQRMIGSAKLSAWSEAKQEQVTDEETLPSNLQFGSTTLSDLAGVLSDRVLTAATAREFETADLTQFAKARTARASIATVCGRVKFPGSGGILPGQTLEVTGTSDRFGGTGYVTAVDHDLNGGVWSTTAHLGLPQDWVTDGPGAAAPGAEALTAPIQGLQIGKVLQLQDDPGSKQRILISLPMIGDPPAQVWARYAAPYASAGYGIQFLPEIDDEVVVAFLDADPNAPIIVGSLHNAKAERPEAATDDNFIKTIVTREELKMIFDDEKKVITLETPGGHKIVMDDDATSITLEDSNGNTVVMDGSGIAMTTDFDINLTATGDINIAATGDANISGMNVNCEADTGFVGKGGATAELSSGGNTKVEGSMVNIN